MAEQFPIDLSPSELALDVLQNYLPAGVAPGGIMVGQANDAAQQAGCVQIVSAGAPRTEKYAPIVWERVQLRCIARSMEHADRIARQVERVMHGRSRVVARQYSTGQDYLIHLINVTARPSAHYDSAETWEFLMFAEMMVGTQPIS